MSRYLIEGTAKKVLEYVKEGVKVNEMSRRLNITRQVIGLHLKRLCRNGYIKPHPCTWEITENGEKFI